jgi:hypothetical protein
MATIGRRVTARSGWRSTIRLTAPMRTVAAARVWSLPADVDPVRDEEHGDATPAFED